MNDLPAIRAVVFDLDGTLIDSAPDITAALNHALEAEGLSPLPLETVRGMIGHGVRALCEKALAACGVRTDPERVERLFAVFMDFAGRDPASRTIVYPGARETLSGLRAAGLHVGLCTNKQQALAGQVLAALGLAPLFDIVIGGGTYPMKPDPAPLLAAAAALGATPAGTLYVGDMGVDRLTARAAGAPFLGVDHGHWRADDPHLQGAEVVRDLPAVLERALRPAAA